jgi:hypothetical protein
MRSFPSMSLLDRPDLLRQWWRANSIVRACATRLGMPSRLVSVPDLGVVEAPAFMRGKERFSAPGGLSSR